MEHLDLAGVITTPTTWSMTAFDQQDAVYLSNSRQMLEPILEETSEDEEHAQNSWNQYEQSTSFWSSAESETGSVIRVEINKDPDSISERDFACPPKRPRRSEEFLIGGPTSQAQQSQQQQQQFPPASSSQDDTVLLRRYQRTVDYNELNSNSLERFLAYEACSRDSWGANSIQRSSTGSRRYDDFSDSDSLSYHSLSRSSSLIQFESLERQMQLQDQHASMTSLGNSSPSLLSFDGANGTTDAEGARSGGNSGSNSGNNSRRGSQSSLLKRFEASDGRLHQTYFDLDKLDFDDDQRVLCFGASKSNIVEATIGEIKSDSESSTSSGSSSGNSILTASKPSAEDLTDSSSAMGTKTSRIAAFQRAGKSSAENLSEDSGYCEPSTLRRSKSKSISKNFEKFCEEEEEFQQQQQQQHEYTTERQRRTTDDDDDAIDNEGEEEDVAKTSRRSIIEHTSATHSKNSNIIHYAGEEEEQGEHDICQPKINDATFIVEATEQTAFEAPSTSPLPTTSAARTPATPSSPLPPPTLRSASASASSTPSPSSSSATSASTVARSVEETPHSTCQYYGRVKNSPSREATASLEHLRSLAHSPSPVSSDASGSSCATTRSSTSASTCASAASFTWLPIQLQQQQQHKQQQRQQPQPQRQQHQHQQQHQQPLLPLLPHQRPQPKQTLADFYSTLRNSLPDIRDALSSETEFIASGDRDKGLELIESSATTTSSSKTRSPTATTTTTTTTATSSSLAIICDDSDTSSASPTSVHYQSPSIIKSPRDETPGDTATSLDQSRNRGVHTSGSGSESESRGSSNSSVSSGGGGGGGGGCGGGGGGGEIDKSRNCVDHRGERVHSCVNRACISSAPSELNRYGRKKRVNKFLYKHASTDSSSGEEAEYNIHHSDDDIDDFFANYNSSSRIRRSCSWSERRDRNTKSDQQLQLQQQQQHRRSLGFLTTSYQNLTLLDYSSDRPYDEDEDDEDDQEACQFQNHKRSGKMDTPKSTASGDYETLICKGNFLLDELSEIYDRNASILNDKPAEAAFEIERDSLKFDEMDQVNGGSPRPPPRQRKHSNSSYSDLENTGADENAVQYVQLTIRKPPARQKHGRHSETTNSLVTEGDPLRKTFDQDPTNLRTSYAQSLEKCNFDPKELSSSELPKAQPVSSNIPKRRFQTHAAATKKRNMVSSTPNLNAFDPHADEIEDDMYVSSAHTSMHQLPQSPTQKPLGILLPVGSRTSFGKEVSFCPVVSKYSWQEQESEETSVESPHREDGREEEESDDELLDNADATVILNTKKNEMIAARFGGEENTEEREQPVKSVAHIREQMPAVEKVRATMIVKESDKESRDEDEENENEESANEERKTSQENEVKMEMEKLVTSAIVEKVVDDDHCSTQAELHSHSQSQAESMPANGSQLIAVVSLKPTIVDEATTTVSANQPVNSAVPSLIESNQKSFSALSDYSGNGGGQQSSRPLSIQLPILSEPPTNRAHHILYASQQLLDDFEKREREQEYSDRVVDRTKSQSVNNLNSGVPGQVRMSREVGVGANAGVSGGMDMGQQPQPILNNNNEMRKSKFKDEKHPSSKGFLSRFAHGFRFSLRRNKKKQLQQQKEQQQLAEQQLQQQQQQNGYTDNRGDKQMQQAQAQAQKSGSRAVSQVSQEASRGKIGAKMSGKQQQQQQQPQQQQQQSNAQKKVTGKPPLPKQPPRSATLPSNLGGSNGPQSAGPHAHNAGVPQQRATNAANFIASQKPQQQQQPQQQPGKSRSQFYTDFLDEERSYYDDFKNQLNSGMQANGRAAAATHANAADGAGANGLVAASQYASGAAVDNEISHLSVSPETIMILTGNGPIMGGDAGGANANANGSGSGKFNGHDGATPMMSNCNKIGLIETNLDTHETVITGKTRSLVDIMVGPSHQDGTINATMATPGKYARRLNMTISGNGGGRDNDVIIYDDDDAVGVGGGAAGAGGMIIKTTTATGGQIASVRRPHKSMEFLLDKENQKNVLPPENELQKSHEHNPAALSEHQLRVQASLQRLNIPDWFRQYNQNTSRSPDGGGSTYKPGNFTRKRTTESGRWAGLNSKTTSLSSLGSQRSDRSPLLLSPSAHSHHGGQSAITTQQHTGTGAYGTGGPGSFSRWSTSHLNSSQTSPSVSQRGTFTRGGPINSSFISVASGNSSAIRNSFRQPYLGWRSQEKLSQRTPHERLASSLLAQQQRTSPTQRNGTLNGGNGNDKLQPVTPEIQSSIKEVTSAIVHYVNDQTNQQRSRSTSPNSRKCWLESSFVGIRPLDSPQTPIIDNTTATAAGFTGVTGGVSNLSSANDSSATYYNYNYNYNTSNSSATSSIYSNTLTSSIPSRPGAATVTAPGAAATQIGGNAINANVLRMNGLSIVGGGESTILI